MSPELPTGEVFDALARRVLASSTADACRVVIAASASSNTRFAVNEITTAGTANDTEVTITSTIGRRRASTVTNMLDDDSLRKAVELSERLARLSPEDPELMPELGAQRYLEVDGWNTETAGLGPEDRAAAAGRVLQLPEITRGSLDAAGFIEMHARARVVATSTGLVAHHRGTSAEMSTTVRTPDGTGSGWASSGSRAWTDIDPAALGARATRKALASRKPEAIEPGPYMVILEPQAVAGLIPLLMRSFDARGADEGRSPFSARDGGNRIGQHVADQRVTIWSDPADPEVRAQPFDGEGLPIGRTAWIESGVLKSLAYSRFWAQKQGTEPRVSPGRFGDEPVGGLKMSDGTKTVDQLVADTARGILVTRFWYIRYLDERTVLLTGLTRDGTFLVENGKVTRPIKNFRWNERPLFMLNKIEELGRAERISAGGVLPAIKARDFTFRSISDAV
jgi:predicted Zn-dependent protease